MTRFFYYYYKVLSIKLSYVTAGEQILQWVVILYFLIVFFFVGFLVFEILF